MDFKERFKGRAVFMKKDGHLGLVLQHANPIPKEDPKVSKPIQSIVRNSS